MDVSNIKNTKRCQSIELQGLGSFLMFIIAPCIHDAFYNFYQFFLIIIGQGWSLELPSMTVLSFFFFLKGR